MPSATRSRFVAIWIGCYAPCGRQSLQKGRARVYVAGQKEREHEATCMRDGVPVPTGVLEEILDIGRTYGVSL